MPSGGLPCRQVLLRHPLAITSMRVSTRKRTRWYFDDSRVRRTGLPSLRPAQSARMMCRVAAVRQFGAGSYDLAARYRCYLPAGQAARRHTGYRLAEEEQDRCYTSAVVIA